MVFKNQIPGIKISLWSYPNVITYLGRAIKTTLNVRLRAKKNTIPNLEGFEMLEADTAANQHAIAEATCDRPPDGTSH